MEYSSKTTKTVEMAVDYSDRSMGQNSDFPSARYEHTEPEKEPARMNDEFERSAILCFRYFIVFLMIAGTIAASATSYFYLEGQEDRDMDKEVRCVLLIFAGSFYVYSFAHICMYISFESL